MSSLKLAKKALLSAAAVTALAAPLLAGLAVQQVSAGAGERARRRRVPAARQGRAGLPAARVRSGVPEPVDGVRTKIIFDIGDNEIPVNPDQAAQSAPAGQGTAPGQGGAEGTVIVTHL